MRKKLSKDIFHHINKCSQLSWENQKPKNILLFYKFAKIPCAKYGKFRKIEKVHLNDFKIKKGTIGQHS